MTSSSHDHGTTRPDPFTEICITALHTTRGANYWSRRPITRMDIHTGAYEEISSADVPGMIEQLLAALPGLDEHRCSVGTRGGFIQRLRSGTYASHITEHVALELQSMIGDDVGYGQTRGTGDVGEYTLVFEHRHEAVGLRAAVLALETVQHAFAGTLISVAHATAELRALAERPTPAPPHQHVLCGITGGTARATTRDDIIRLVGCGRGVTSHPLVIDVSPFYLLQAGLPYTHSDIAIILDTELFDVPDRYRDPERAARLVATVADAVPRRGPVVCPAHAHYVHELIRDAERHVVKFEASQDDAAHARHAARAAAEALGVPAETLDILSGAPSPRPHAR